MKAVNGNKPVKNSIASGTGKANLSIRQAVAGSLVNCKLTFTVGELGINKGGSIKFLFRAVSDIGLLQFENSNKPNFALFKSSNPNLEIKVNASSTNFFGKLHTRPWTKGFMLVFENVSLESNDQIILTFQNWQMQTFCEKLFEIKILVDPFAVGKFWEILNSPTINIIPAKPARLVILSPTNIVMNKPLKSLVKFEDEWGNPCLNFNGVFKLTLKIGSKLFHRKARFQKGKALITTRLTQNGVTNIQVSCNHFVAVSNPIMVEKTLMIRHFWADLHGQSEETVGIKSNTLNDFFLFAKNYGFLDVVSHQGNDFQITDRFWRKMNRLTKSKTKDGKFIVLPGFEWSGNTSNGGDRNVIFLNDNESIFRSSRALVSNLNSNNDTPTALGLFKTLSKTKALVIAHAGGRPATLSMHDDKLEKLVEVHSAWGNSEWLLNEALSRGFKVGVVAGSDGHTGRPGAEFPTLDLFKSNGGLTCIFSNKLTRMDIFKALCARHCYATTGTRIFLDVKLINKTTSEVWFMGDKLSSAIGSQMELAINTVGTTAVKKIEIHDGIECIATRNIFGKTQIIIKKTLNRLTLGGHQLFVKVIQQDGNMAWSSPIFLNILETPVKKSTK